MVTYSGWEALLKGSPYGKAAVVEVVDELWVNGATELSHLPVSWSDEDALDGLHENVVKQGVLCPRGQPVPKKRQCLWSAILYMQHLKACYGSLLSVIHLLGLFFCHGLLQGAQVEGVRVLHPGYLNQT